MKETIGPVSDHHGTKQVLIPKEDYEAIGRPRYVKRRYERIGNILKITITPISVEKC